MLCCWHILGCKGFQSWAGIWVGGTCSSLCCWSPSNATLSLSSIPSVMLITCCRFGGLGPHIKTFGRRKAVSLSLWDIAKSHQPSSLHYLLCPVLWDLCHSQKRAQNTVKTLMFQWRALNIQSIQGGCHGDYQQEGQITHCHWSFLGPHTVQKLVFK